MKRKKAKVRESEVIPPKLPAYVLAFVVSGLLAGLVARLVLPVPALKWAFPFDHFDNIGMGLTAGVYGLTKVYSVPKDKNPEVVGTAYYFRGGKLVPRERYRRRAPRVTNYPPLGITLLHIQTELLRKIDPSIEANTYTSRLVMSLGAIIADLVLALGVYLVVRVFAGRIPALVASLVCWCFPPLILNTAFWGQIDSWFLAPGVLMVWFLMRRRWIAAGICLSLALLLKPQGLLLMPIALFAVFMVREGEGRLTAKVLFERIGKGLAATLIATFVISIPWTLADGTTWFERSYVDNFKLTGTDELTAWAFNIWYIDLLVNDNEPTVKVVDSQVQVFGLTKQRWGQILALSAMIALGGTYLWRYRTRGPLGVVLFGSLWLWSTFILLTAAHERFIIYCTPLLIAGAVKLRGLWVAVLLLGIIGTAELTHYSWLEVPAGRLARKTKINLDRYDATPPHQRPSREDFEKGLEIMRQNIEEGRKTYRPWEYLFTVGSIAAYAWALAVAFLGWETAWKKDGPAIARKH